MCNICKEGYMKLLCMNVERALCRTATNRESHTCPVHVSNNRFSMKPPCKKWIQIALTLLKEIVLAIFETII